LNKDYYYNSGHFNKTGAELFTVKVMNDLIRTGIVCEFDPDTLKLHR
jgi:hypothetical protein